MASPIASTGGEQYPGSVATENVACSLLTAASVTCAFKMHVKEGLSSNLGWLGGGKTNLEGGFRTLAKLSSANHHHGKQVMGILFTPGHSALYKCESILLFDSAWKGVKRLLRLRCHASAKGSAYLEQTITTEDRPLNQAEKEGDRLFVEGDRLFVEELSQRPAFAKRNTYLRKGKRITSENSVLLSRPASAEGNGGVRAKLEKPGILVPAILKYIEETPNLTEDDILNSATYLMRLLGINQNESFLIMSKCASLLKADPQKIKDLVTFLFELGMDQEDLSNMLTSHPAFFSYNLDVMRGNVDYLISIGVPKEELPGVFMKRPHVLGFKAAQIKFIFGCFLEAAVPPKDLVRVLKKVPELFSPITQKNLKSRMLFFKHIGLDGGALGKGIARRPNLLNFDLERMKRTHQYLQDFMTPGDVAKLVRRFPEVLVLDPDRKMEPIVNHLLQLGVQRENIGKVLLRRPQLLGYTVAGLEPTVKYLKELGVKECFIGRVISISPQVLTLNCEEKLKPAIEYLRSIGLNQEKDMERLLVRNAQLLCCSIEKNLKPKLELFLKMGLSTKDVIKVMVLFPSMFGQSIEGSLSPKYDYLINVMKRSPREIVDFPQYFGYSLETRIKSRFEKLAARGLQVSLPSMLACVDVDFHNRYLVGDPPSRAPYKMKKQPRKSKYNF